MNPLITPKLDITPTEQPGSFRNSWYLFLESVTALSNYLLVQVTALLAAGFVLGAANLTHVGRLLKVSAAGTAAESSLTDNGTVVSGTEPLHLDNGTLPKNAQIVLHANALGALGLLCLAADNLQVQLDFERIDVAGTATNVAANAIVARIIKNGGLLLFQWASGQTVGTAIGTSGTAALTTGMSIDLATGYVGFGGNVAQAYPVDATGDINASGVLRVAGTQVVGPQLAAVAAPTINTTTATGTAGALYTPTEQAMINQHVTAINQLNVDVANLATAVNALRSRLSTTGITL